MKRPTPWFIYTEDGRFAYRTTAKAATRWAVQAWQKRPSLIRFNLNGNEVGHLTYGGFSHIYGSDDLKAAVEAWFQTH